MKENVLSVSARIFCLTALFFICSFSTGICAQEALADTLNNPLAQAFKTAWQAKDIDAIIALHKSDDAPESAINEIRTQLQTLLDDDFVLENITVLQASPQISAMMMSGKSIDGVLHIPNIEITHLLNATFSKDEHRTSFNAAAGTENGKLRMTLPIPAGNGE